MPEAVPGGIIGRNRLQERYIAGMIVQLDHLVLTVADIERSVAFYSEVLSMRHVVFGEGRHALAFGEQKINLHQCGKEFEPKAAKPTAGSADLCFVSLLEPAQLLLHLQKAGVEIELGPVPRSGAMGPVSSVYLRDPDGNPIELCYYPA